MAEAENKIQQAVLKHLQGQGIFCWRQNNGSQYDQKLGFYRSHVGLKGVPDIIGVLPTGQFLGVECKTAKGKQSADQLLFERAVKRNNGVYIVARSVADVKDIIKTPG